jgi:hypothetical protein
MRGGVGHAGAVGAFVSREDTDQKRFIPAFDEPPDALTFDDIHAKSDGKFRLHPR